FWIAFFIGLALYGLLGMGADSRDTRYSMTPHRSREDRPDATDFCSR
ncbi:MAG: hypothetical protein JWO63_180, partial [Frankiales bacterium]|nr:hypothetical protein [Frankiales bacterium]